MGFIHGIPLDILIITGYQPVQAEWKIMQLTKRHLALALLALVIIIVALMASSLSNLELRPGRIVPGGSVMDLGGSSVSSWGWILEKYETFLKILLILAPFAVIASLLIPRGRRGLLIFGIILIAIFLFKQLPLKDIKLEMPQMEIQGQPKYRPPQDTVPESIPDPPKWLVFLISIIVSALILGLAYFLWQRFRPRPTPLTQVAEEVKKAIEDIHSGADLKEGVLRCYFEMSRVINEQRGIKRNQAMTAREFEMRLEKAGLPGVHVERLTRLFEKVRYGGKDLDETEEKEALSCLNSILDVCERGI